MFTQNRVPETAREGLELFPLSPSTAFRRHSPRTHLTPRKVIALCHLGMGTVRQRLGSPERAHEHLRTAVAMLRDMGMALWLADAEALLAKA